MTASSYLFGYATQNKKSYSGKNEGPQDRERRGLSAVSLPAQT